MLHIGRATARHLAANAMVARSGSGARGMATLPSPDRFVGGIKIFGGVMGGMCLASLFSSPEEDTEAPAATAVDVKVPAKPSPEELAPVLAKAMEIAAVEASLKSTSKSAASASTPSSSSSGQSALDLEDAWRKAVSPTYNSDYTPNGRTAQRIAAVTPYFPFKGIPRFYDIGGFLKKPAEFQLAIDAFVERYRDQDIDSIAGFDARGFILGPPIALALKKPFIMLRKKGKMPNSITGSEYSKEYAGNDSLSIPRGSVKEGDRVLLIDDLVATGGTLVAGIELVKQMGGIPVEAACVVELKFLDARKKFAENGHSDVPIWALMDEEILTLDGLADPSIPTDGYKDDGEAH